MYLLCMCSFAEASLVSYVRTKQQTSLFAPTSSHYFIAITSPYNWLTLSLFWLIFLSLLTPFRILHPFS